MNGEAQESESGNVPSPPSGASILVAESDPETADLLRNWLSLGGYDVQVVTTGNGVSNSVQTSPPDVVLLDIQLPPHSGLEVLHALKGNDRTRSIPVIVVALKHDVRGKVECLNNGADDYIVKPFHFDEVDAIVRCAIRKRKQTSMEYERLLGEKDELMKRLAELTITDDRTGLYNDRFLRERMTEAFDYSQRYGAPLSVMMLDLDHFKRVNDDYGHDAGDTVLQGFAELLRANARSTDTVGRYGGEEFLVIFPHTDAVRAAIVGERIRKAAEDHVYRQGEKAIRVTVSGGVACVPANSEIGTVAELVKVADDSLRRAKETRNRVLIDPPSLPREIRDGDLSRVLQASYEDDDAPPRRNRR
jgi:diguanylate cyclase (GGDEF)-like protein